MFISEDGFIRSKITTEGVVESKPLEAPPAIEPALSVSPSPPPGSDPLSVLGLSLRPHNALMRADITDIGQLAAMSREQLREVRSVGEKGLTEIEEKLKAYLAEHPVLDEVEEGSTEPETQAAESLPPQLPSQPPDPIPLGILGLSGRPHFALMQAGITTVGQLAAMSREQIREMRNVSEKGLTEIEEKLAAYLAEHPLPDVSQHQGREMPELTSENVPPHVSKKTSITVLKLSADIRARLKLAGVTTIEDLARMSPEHILDVPYIDEKSLTEIESTLADYLGEHFPSGSPFKLEKPSVANAPLGTLGLSVRSHNALMRAGIRTVGKLVGMSDKDLLNVHNIGVKSLADIREKLAAYLAEHPLPDKAEEGTPKPETQVAEPIPPQLFTPPPDPTPLGALELSIRPYNALRRGGITTIGQLATMSREQIREVRNVGERALAEIEEKLVAYLTVHPLPTKPAPSMEKPKSSPPPPPLADPKVLNSAREKGIPLDGISVKRLALPESFQILLHRENIETISELALQPRKKWRRRVTVVQHLNRYLAWLIEQDETIWANEVTGQDISPLHWLELTETSMENLAGKWLSVLDSRDNQVVRWRYGLEGEELTLEEVGERLNITRERVRQIQNRTRRALGKPQSRAVIRPLLELLLYLLEQAGGLMNETQLEAALQRELVIGDVDPVGVARLVFDLHDDFKWIRKAQTWGLTRFPLTQVPSINRHLTEVLEKAYVPLPSDKVVARFKETRFYQNRRDALDDAFIVTCLRTHPTIEVDSGGMCGLTKWATRKPDKIVLALQQIGHPVHYSVLAERVNALLPPDQQTLARNIQAILNRYPNIFVHLGRGKYWLRGHLIEEASASPQADFGDLFGARLTRWQAELDRRQGSCELDTHTEVDIIRNVGLDFFTK